MRKRKNPCAGSSLESVLREAGIFEEIQADVKKMVILELIQWLIKRKTTLITPTS